MEQFIVIYSRYVIALLAILYAVLSLVRVFLSSRKGRPVDTAQTVCIFIWQFVAFLTLCLETGELDALFFYAFSQITLFASMMLFLMIYPGMNRPLLNHMCFLLGTGLLILGRLDLQQAIRPGSRRQQHRRHHCGRRHDHFHGDSICGKEMGAAA